MNYHLKQAVTVVILVVLFFISNVEWEAGATSWAELDPQDVIERAEVVVVGTYDFEGKDVSSSGIFTGYPFYVKKVYRGEATEKITAGIDEFDIGLVSDWQENGGEYLLFLKQQDDADFLVPVAVPNGMIEMKDGEVQGEKAKAYSEFLASEAEKEPVENEETENSSLVGVGAIVVIVTLIVGFIVYKKRNK